MNAKQRFHNNSEVRRARMEAQHILVERRQIVGEIEIEQDNPNGESVFDAALRMIASEMESADPGDNQRYEFKFGRELITVEHEVLPRPANDDLGYAMPAE